MGDPPDIDPYGHAVESRHWGSCSCHLVRHEGRYYAWLAGADGRPLVYPMASEAATRGFLDDWQATNLLHTRWDEMVVHIFLLDPGQGPQNADTPGRGSAAGGARIIYHSAVIDVEGDGIWVASYEDTANGHDGGDHHGVCMAAWFTDLGPALHAFAARAEQAAGRVERERVSTVPDVVAGVLRYRAAEARVTAARATVGDAVRRSERQLRAAPSISPLASAIGISREFLYRVLAGDEWTWPYGPRTRPPGSRLPDTPVTTLAAYTVDSHQFALVSYTDTAGSKCVAVDQDGERGAAVCDVEVSAKDLVKAGMTMASKTMGQGLAAVYGRAHDSVTGLYAVMRSGERVAWPIHYDPRNQERYFAVIADCQQLEDIVAVAGRRRTSLKRNFGIWFRAAPLGVSLPRVPGETGSATAALSPPRSPSSPLWVLSCPCRRRLASVALVTAPGRRRRVSGRRSGREQNDVAQAAAAPGPAWVGYPLEVQPRPHPGAQGPAVDPDLLGDVDGGGETAAARSLYH